MSSNKRKHDDASNELPNPKRLKMLVSSISDPEGNTLLHQFVLDNSYPNNSGSTNYINAVLLSMSDISVNAVNKEGYSALHLAVLKNNLLMVKKLLSCLANIDVDSRCDNTVLCFNRTALLLAAQLGHLPIMEELLNHGANPDLKNKYDDSALFIATHCSNLDMIKLLISRGAKVNLKSRFKKPLHYAAVSGNFEITKFLVSKGAFIDVKYISELLNCAPESVNLDVIKFLLDGVCVNFASRNGSELLVSAARFGNAEILELILNKGTDVNAVDSSGKTPLHHALRNLDTVKYLVNKGADLHIRDNEGKTPLHCALYNLLNMTCTTEGKAQLQHESTNLPTVEFLLSHGADVHARDKKGRTPLHYAAYSGLFENVECLVNKGANLNAMDKKGQTPIYYTIMGNGLKCAAFLLDKGADLSAINKKGKTILHGVVEDENCSIEFIKLLIERGADVNARNTISGYTALHYLTDLPDPMQPNSVYSTFQNYHSDYKKDAVNKVIMKIKLLLKENADVNIPNNGMKTPLHFAIELKDLDIVELLFESRVDLNAKYMDGNTILHFVCEPYTFVSLDIIEKLLRNGSDVNAKNDRDETPLHIAAYKLVLSRVNLLLDRGAHVNVADINGWTALHAAAYKGHERNIHALLLKNADINAKNKDGKTPLDLARENKHSLCVDVLQKWN